MFPRIQEARSDSTLGSDARAGMLDSELRRAPPTVDEECAVSELRRHSSDAKIGVGGSLNITGNHSTFYVAPPAANMVRSPLSGRHDQLLRRRMEQDWEFYTLQRQRQSARITELERCNAQKNSRIAQLEESDQRKSGKIIELEESNYRLRQELEDKDGVPRATSAPVLPGSADILSPVSTTRVNLPVAGMAGSMSNGAAPGSQPSPLGPSSAALPMHEPHTSGLPNNSRTVPWPASLLGIPPNEPLFSGNQPPDLSHFLNLPPAVPAALPQATPFAGAVPPVETSKEPNGCGMQVET